MRIFISWSKARGKQVAQALAGSMPAVNHLFEPWLSPQIKPGSRWQEEISDQLRDVKVGVVCVTPEALNSPWLNFEAGALAKDDGAVLCPYVFGFESDDDRDASMKDHPLKALQYVNADRDGTLTLFQVLNSALPKKQAKPDAALRTDFGKEWPRLKRLLDKVHAAPKEVGRDHARRALEGINRGAGPLPSEVERSLWMPVLFQQIRSGLNGRGAAKRALTLDVFDINALAPLHSGFELFLEILGRGGRVRIMMLDPRSKAFVARSALEGDGVGRIAAEEVASFHILANLIAMLRRKK